MRLTPRNFNTETFVCSVKGHQSPAESVRALRAQDGGLGVELPDGRRLARCTRCDSWTQVKAPGAPGAPEHLPELSKLTLPRRGKPLRDALVMRMIALEKALHFVAFSLIAVGLLVLDLKLPGLQHGANDIVRSMQETGAPEQATVSRLAHHLIGLHRQTLTVLAAGAGAYGAMEGIEGLGLWLERRWAEYLTVLATAVFLPFEIHELLGKVTLFRSGAFALNLAIVIYLVYVKRLFGLRGGRAALLAPTQDPALLFAAPVPDAQ